MGKLNSSMIKETDQMKTKRIYSTEMDLSAVHSAKGFSNEKLDDIEEFVDKHRDSQFDEYVYIQKSE
ncbi:hypothetical protein VNO80_21922 [Phaseolus coccineus]|uniref:Uncharacterized protein n=1 Tax=Phaseolus coccineus TaxID=3886 RepID=A0AAN9M8Q4_PHACN